MQRGLVGSEMCIRDSINAEYMGVKYYQKFFAKEPTDIRIKEQKKRWGSCTSKNELLFNWRCIMAKSNALDYIVVHEMCHMYHKDHSKEFWELVASVLPDFEVRKEWLRNYGVRMDLQIRDKE
eukprot:TRINITY_DN12210_c0_g1_i4.p3 TRINITY_DN12210_c0_g1~~TRINITY_DN12210_c0_g1_i4.p3  ORF type:complete len:123 (+),score=27.65 TRINITY_DN12210_c0_g1_i4:169-537(+)